MANDVRSGGCVCGEVRYTTPDIPLRVTVCHCLWCQRRTGTAFGTEAVFAEHEVVFSGEKPARYRHHSDESGRWLDVEFCGRCGTNLGFTLEAVPGVRTVAAGTFDDPGWLDGVAVPLRHVYARSRRHWGDITADVEVFDQHFRR